MVSPFLCCPVNRECHVKENPDRKKKQTNPFVSAVSAKVWRLDFLKLKNILLNVKECIEEERT